MNTEITNAVNAAGDKAQYDARVKRILAQKNILAHILVKTVDEFKGMKPEDVVTYIEGEPKVGIVPVEPGLSNIEKTDATGQRIVGLNTENAEINEGLVRFDIIFYVRMKNGLSQIIVNVEAQKDEPTEYKIFIYRHSRTFQQPRELSHIDFPIFIFLVVFPKLVRQTVNRSRRSPDLFSLSSGILYTRFHSLRNDIALHLREYAPHLDHPFRHRVEFSF